MQTETRLTHSQARDLHTTRELAHNHPSWKKAHLLRNTSSKWFPPRTIIRSNQPKQTHSWTNFGTAQNLLRPVKIDIKEKKKNRKHE